MSVANPSPYDEPQHDPISTPPSGISGKPIEEIIEVVEAWFGENFQDPVHHTPIDDGEYVYIWGGPYETRDIIENIFADELTDEEIRAVTEALDSESLEWVPHSRRQQPPDDYDPGTAEPVKTTEQLHQQMLEYIADAEKLLAKVDPKPSPASIQGIGHNNPPEAIDEVPVSRKEFDELREALASLKAQSVQPNNNDQVKADEARQSVESTGKKILSWTFGRIADFAKEAIKGAGKVFGTAPYETWHQLGVSLQDVAQAAEQWLHALHFWF